uniref:Uncharacterized protein n=1 Tax=Sinorhizobium fredii (strain NBRC 101917 / NGR234) TaxID=394 RepID=Q6W2G6_SINFN|nr:Hypothetical protein RNGR00024 [Sinorhizobium fredii NGR234]
MQEILRNRNFAKAASEHTSMGKCHYWQGAAERIEDQV